MRKRRQAEMKRYFTMSQEDRNRYLDERINQMEQGRQARQGQGRGGPGGTGAGGTFGAAPGGGNGQEPPGNNREARDQRRMEMLDGTTPAERGEWTEFRKELNARRAQLGLPTGGGFGPGR
jgi:hypothetical protein